MTAASIDSELSVTTPNMTRRVPVLLIALTVLVAVSAAAVGVLGWQVRADSQLRDAREQALEAARTATAEVLSYNPKDVEAGLANARQLVSGTFSIKFDQLASTVIEPATKQQGLTTNAKVLRAAVIDSGPEQLNALLFVSQTTTSMAQPRPDTVTNQIKVTMTKAGGRWLISDMQPL